MTNTTKVILAIVVVAILAFLGWVIAANRSATTTPSPSPSLTTAVATITPSPSPISISVPLSEQNKSGEKGTATITEVNGKAVVSIDISSTATVPQPAHIHTGSCPNPGAVKYPLSNVVNGKSETTLNIPVSTLLSELPLAINVHKSAAQTTVYVSCGDIPNPSSGSATIVSPSPSSNIPGRGNLGTVPPSASSSARVR